MLPMCIHVSLSTPLSFTYTQALLLNLPTFACSRLHASSPAGLFLNHTNAWPTTEKKTTTTLAPAPATAAAHVPATPTTRRPPPPPRRRRRPIPPLHASPGLPARRCTHPILLLLLLLLLLLPAASPPASTLHHNHHDPPLQHGLGVAWWPPTR